MKPFARLSSFWHPAFGYFTLTRWAAREYTTGQQVEAAALLVMQSGE